LCACAGECERGREGERKKLGGRAGGREGGSERALARENNADLQGLCRLVKSVVKCEVKRTTLICRTLAGVFDAEGLPLYYYAFSY